MSPRPGSTTTLQFDIRQDPSYFLLDSVSVTPAGAPDSGPGLALSVAALLGLCVLATPALRRLLLA